MSDAVFVDTGAWISMLSRGDQRHRQTLRYFQLFKQQKRDLLTTSAVLTEVLDGLTRHHFRHLSAFFRQEIDNFSRLEIVYVDKVLFQRGWDFYEARTDKDWSLTDCLSFVVMQQRSMSEALAHDHHFEQAGFRALLRET